jgi:hypothetical protein
MAMKCAICGATEDLQRHHISHNPEIIKILCRKCHQLQHKNHGVGLSKFQVKSIPVNFAELWRTRTYDKFMQMFNISYATVHNWAKKLGLGAKRVRSPTVPIIGGKIRCPKCSYEWQTRSKCIYVTCPSCLDKVKIRELKKKKLQRGEIDASG